MNNVLDALKARVGALTAPKAPAAEPAPTAAPQGPTAVRPASQVADARRLQSLGTSKLGVGAMSGTAPLGTTARLQSAGALGELGVVGALAEVAKAYTKTSFDPQAIGASLGKLADQLQQVSGQVLSMPGVGDAVMGLGGVGAIASGLNGLRESITAAKDAKDTPDKVAASLGAAAGAAKIAGGLAMALSPFCAPLAPVGAAITAAGAAMDAGKLAIQNRATVSQAMATFQNKLFKTVTPATREAVDQAARILSNNSAAMVGAR